MVLNGNVYLPLAFNFFRLLIVVACMISVIILNLKNINKYIIFTLSTCIGTPYLLTIHILKFEIAHSTTF